MTVLRQQTISGWTLLILALPLLVLTGSELILGYMGDRGVAVPTGLISDPVRVDLAARYNTLASFVFFAMVAIAVSAIFFWDVWRHFEAQSQVKIVAPILMGVISSTWSVSFGF